MPNQSLFHARSSIKDDNLVSVELIERLMQEIHQIWYWNNLEINLYLVLIGIKSFFNFFCQLKHKKQANTKLDFASNSFQYQVWCFSIICESSLTLISYFLLILDNFQNAYLTLIIHISVKYQSKIKTNVSTSKLAHWESKHVSILKITLLLCILLHRCCTTPVIMYIIHRSVVLGSLAVRNRCIYDKDRNSCIILWVYTLNSLQILRNLNTVGNTY